MNRSCPSERSCGSARTCFARKRRPSGASIFSPITAGCSPPATARSKASAPARHGGLSAADRAKGATPATVATLATKPPPNPETVATVATVARGEAENTADRRGPHADALLELADYPPPKADAIAWRDACEGAAMFEGTHGPGARLKGWTAPALYGAAPVNPLGQLDRLGAALRIGREGVHEVTPDCIVTLTGRRIAGPNRPASLIEELLHRG